MYDNMTISQACRDQYQYSKILNINIEYEESIISFRSIILFLLNDIKLTLQLIVHPHLKVVCYSSAKFLYFNTF